MVHLHLLPALLALQSADAGWVGPTMAWSLLVIALAFVAIAVAILAALRGLVHQMKAIGDTVTRLEDRVAPALDQFKIIATDGKEIATMVRQEAAAMVSTSRRLRRRVRRGARRIEERLQDLDALYEVVHEELEEAALDFATVVRTVRTGGGWLTRLARFFPRRRRR